MTADDRTGRDFDEADTLSPESKAHQSTGTRPFPSDPYRYAAMKVWCDRVGIPVNSIPAEEGALVVTPLAEGEFDAVFVQFDRDADGLRVIDHADCAPGDHHCAYLRRDQRTRLVVTEPPPGFALPSWDAYAYVQHLTDYASAS